MKKIIFAVILSLLCFTKAQASEIFGRISTNPNLLPSNASSSPANNQLPNDSSNAAPAPTAEQQNSGGGGAILFPATQKQASNASIENQIQENQIQPEVVTKPADSDIKVLGIIYHDKTLLRGSAGRIFFTTGQTKKYITNLNELKKYAGQEIYDVSDEELAQYQDKGHLDNDLIRERGDDKIYVIKNGKKQHILNLEELRAHWFGQEIFNISREEMILY